jgi:outer membrane protein with beta-barrel domain
MEVTMRRAFVLILVLFAAPCLALGQSSRSSRGQGYLFAAPGGASGGGGATLHFGGGGEALVYEGLGVGAELGYLAPVPALDNGIGILSTNVSYHFARANAVEPFITGGYSLAFRSGFSSGGNFGGGVNYWFAERAALRLEFRDHIFSSDSPHLYQFRVGLSFR